MSGQNLQNRPTERKTSCVQFGWRRVTKRLRLLGRLQEILTATCKAAVELLKVDHSGLMVFDLGREQGHVICEFPAIGIKGSNIQMNGLCDEQRQIRFRKAVGRAQHLAGSRGSVR